MKKLPKRPRTFGRTKHKSHKKKRTRLTSEEIMKIFDEMINSPAYWYYIKYDEYGQYAGIDFGTPIKE